MTNTIKVAVDAMGGDNAPSVVIDGVMLALDAMPNLEIYLLGPKEVIDPVANKNPRIVPVEATEVIAMDEHPAQAVRAKKDSSIVLGCRLVKDGKAQGFFSAGSTGAIMSAATLIIGRIRGISRPAIATTLPTGGKPVLMLDCGANADVKPENMLQFGMMGEAYARGVMNVAEPKVSLLNIGEEETKGNALTLESYGLLKENLPNFNGNIEGKELLSGQADVVVTDGFTGNVALKLLEGSSKTLLSAVKRAITNPKWKMIFVAPLASSFDKLKDDFNPDKFGGAVLLGLKGIACIGHGSSSAEAIKNGVLYTARAIKANVPAHIEKTLAG